MPANHLLAPVTRAISGVLLCASPRRYWKVVSTEKRNEQLLCWGIIILLASLRAWPPLYEWAQELLFDRAAGDAQALARGITHGVLYALLIPMGILCAAVIIRFLAPLFQGSIYWLDALKLVTYSLLPVLAASGFGILSAQPVVSVWFWIWHVIVWGWSIALLYEGIGVLTTVHPTQRLSFLTSVATSILLLYLSLGLLGFFIARVVLFYAE